MSEAAQVCPQCGWTFDMEALRANACKKCRSALLITSVAYLEKFDRPAIQKYITRYSNILKTAPDDRDALLIMGVCYLRLGLFDLATKFLSHLIDAHPEDAAGYYYKALCGFKGKRPRTATLNTVRDAEQLISTATTLEPGNARHDVLLAAVRHDYYAVNGLRMPEPTPKELLAGIAGKHLDTQEVEQGLALLNIADSPVFQFVRAAHN
jgi:tetratricopeptide (TPR) repeat protein